MAALIVPQDVSSRKVGILEVSYSEMSQNVITLSTPAVPELAIALPSGEKAKEVVMNPPSSFLSRLKYSCLRIAGSASADVASSSRNNY